MSFAVDLIPELDGAVAEFDNDEYIELYRDTMRCLSSAVWSTDVSPDIFIKECSSVIGDPGDEQRAAIRVMGEKMYRMAAPRAIAFVAKNLGRIAFCRVDFGDRSIIWTFERDEDITSIGDKVSALQGKAEAGLIFRTGDTATAVSTMERTGTSNVRDYANKVVPDLFDYLEHKL